MLISLFIRQDAESVNIRSAWLGDIYVRGTCFNAVCSKGPNIKDTFVGGICIGGALIGVTYIGSVSTVKRLKIHSQWSEILEVGLKDMFLTLGTRARSSC